MRSQGRSFPRADDARKRQLLDSALTVFMRFGFRKTSMDEVARAAEVSRQWLYLHFANKEELFRAVVQHSLETSTAAAESHLDERSLSLEDRLVAAFDEAVGRYVGITGAQGSDLAEVSHALVGVLVKEHEERFLEAVVKALRASRLAAAYKSSGLTPRQLAETLYATARGLKYGCASRAEFAERFALAVRALCAPLGVIR